MNILNLIKKQHDFHRGLLKESLTEENFQELRHSLIQHVYIEERLLFKQLLDVSLFEKEIASMWEEHSYIMDRLKVLDSIPMKEAGWLDAYHDLKNEHLKHISEEEEILFPKIRRSLPDDLLEELGRDAENLSDKDFDLVLYPKNPGASESPPKMNT